MGAWKQLVRTLVQQINGGDTIRLPSQATTYGRLGRLVYAAEQFGFVYDDTHLRGNGTSTVVEVFMHRPPSDAPRPMADASALPGLRGRRLRPLPHARNRVAELTARVRLDAYAYWATRKRWKRALGLAVVPLILLLVEVLRVTTTQAGAEEAPAVFIGVGAALVIVLAVGLYERRAHAAARVLLRSYGYAPVLTHNGDTRLVPPDWTPPPLPGS